ncbi:heterokaryon incompatibility protein-domain-containing protein [Sordaria brevicollis]|uniref:Heterokaryon incompatibility protein-domain-containing protein n=1 Tax=Sordaria brevicollis TaxID=83679 RepID=A0AAE0PLN5_SORBR|nr:heterokaryon incompatibility protein-domain-containing protein [Sordaria brevicollis]
MEPNRLCNRCARALTTSKKLWHPRQAGDEPDWSSDKFFHSKNVKQMLEDSIMTAGCHLCTQVRLDDNFATASDDHRVTIECSRQLAFQGDGRDIPVISFSATSCDQWDDDWAALPDSERDGEPEGNSETIPLATFKLERTDGSGGGRKAILPQKLPDGEKFVLPCSTDSPEAYGLVRHWLDDCLNNHPGCKGSSSSFQRLPTRLVDVGTPDDRPLRPRIFLPDSATQTPATISYLTLSHSWALTGSSLRLTTKTIDDWQKPEGIPIGGLARTFLDAMRITRQLGYRYIWIDSLCIMQDSSEDWNREAQTMAAVYGNSLLTIFASGMGMEGGQGTTPDTAFSVRSNPLEVYAPIITSPLSLSDDRTESSNGTEPNDETANTTDEGASFYAIREQYQHSVDEMLWGAQQKNPLLSRGWIVQERLLSPRIIYYGADELYWECRLHALSESCPFGTVLKSEDNEASQSIWTANAKSVYQDLVHDHRPAMSLATGVDVNNANEDDGKHVLSLAASWTTLLTYYTSTSLTYPSDRLIALAGMVSAIAESKNWTYTFGGSWRELWPFDLLWGFSNILNTEMFNPGWSSATDSNKRQQTREQMDKKLLAGKSLPESQPSTKLGLPTWSWAATEAPKDWWFHSSAQPPNWKCEVAFCGAEEGGILAMRTYKRTLEDMPRIDLVLMWDDDDFFYLKEEVCCLLVLDHLARGGTRALQVGFMVVQVDMAENENAGTSALVEDMEGKKSRRFYCRRVGKWENTWGPLAVDRGRDEETVVYLC